MVLFNNKLVEMLNMECIKLLIVLLIVLIGIKIFMVIIELGIV